MADDQDSLLREVEEEIRREQMQKLWQKYNGVIIGGVLAILASVLFYTNYQSSKKSVAETAGAEFAAALRLAEDSKTSDEALKAFEKIAGGSSTGYRALAKLQLAAADVKAGKNKEAIAAYDSLASDAGVDKMLKQFASLQAASLMMGTADFTEMQNRLKPLTGAGAAYNTTASELLGVAAYKAGDTAMAREYLEPLLIDPTAASALQERIKILLGEIATAELAKAPEAKAPASAASDTKAPATATPEAKPETSAPATKPDAR